MDKNKNEKFHDKLSGEWGKLKCKLSAENFGVEV
jgi:hypothetical protein